MVRKPPINQEIAAPSPKVQGPAPVLEQGKKKSISAANMAKSLGFQASPPLESSPTGYNWPEAPKAKKPFNGDELKAVMADYLGALSIQLGQQTQLIGELKNYTLQQEQKHQAALAQMQGQIAKQSQLATELQTQMHHQEQQQQQTLTQIQAQLDEQKQVLWALNQKGDTLERGEAPLALEAQLNKQYQLTSELKAQLTLQEDQQQVATADLQAQVDRQMKLYQAQIRETEETLSSFVTINSHLVLSLKDQYQGTREEITLLRKQQEYLIDKKIHTPPPTPAPPPEPPTPPKKRFLAFGKRPV